VESGRFLTFSYITFVQKLTQKYSNCFPLTETKYTVFIGEPIVVNSLIC
jgi:hypothetical protein